MFQFIDYVVTPRYDLRPFCFIRSILSKLELSRKRLYMWLHPTLLIIIIIIYSDSTSLWKFHSKLGLRHLPHIKILNISLNIEQTGCRPSNYHGKLSHTESSCSYPYISTLPHKYDMHWTMTPEHPHSVYSRCPVHLQICHALPHSPQVLSTPAPLSNYFVTLPPTYPCKKDSQASMSLINKWFEMSKPSHSAHDLPHQVHTEYAAFCTNPHCASQYVNDDSTHPSITIKYSVSQVKYRINCNHVPVCNKTWTRMQEWANGSPLQTFQILSFHNHRKVLLRG